MVENANELKQTYPGEEQERTCANCACHIIQENMANPLEKQYFCRRDTPMSSMQRMEKPRMRDGKAVMDRNNKPIMESDNVMVYLYKPTLPRLVCFDGWRPEHTLPGERLAVTEVIEMSAAAMRRLMSDIQTQALESVDLGEPKN